MDRVKKLNSIYKKLLKKAVPAASNNLYFLTDKQVTPAIKRSLATEHSISIGVLRIEETDLFCLKRKSEVTGNPYDEGYMLKIKK